MTDRVVQGALLTESLVNIAHLPITCATLYVEGDFDKVAHQFWNIAYQTNFVIIYFFKQSDMVLA